MFFTIERLIVEYSIRTAATEGRKDKSFIFQSMKAINHQAFTDHELAMNKVN